jgi:glycosyltransferase involved in cell wall biosynthesis
VGRLKILHISALPVWSMDGKGGMPSLRETLKGHIAAGHEIELVLPQYDPFSDDTKFLFVPEGQGFSLHFARCRWLPIFKMIRVRARRLGNGDSVPYVLRWILNVAMLLTLTISLTRQAITRQAIKVRNDGFKSELVYAHNQYAALSGFLVSRLWKIPNVTRLYGTFLADLMRKPFVSFRYPTAAAGYLVPSSLLICANDGTRGDDVARKLKISEQRFRFWQNGVDPPSSPPQMTRKDLAARFPRLNLASKWAVSCSRLSYWKRIDRMLRALVVCKRQGVDCQLIVAGDGPEKDTLRGLADELGVSDSVVMLGAVAHDDIWALMNCSDIFMLTNDVTNRCNPLYEAAWAGLPVVSVHDPSTADLLHHRVNALLAEKDDTETLGQCIVEICQDDALKEQISKAQKKLSKTFWTWEERMQVETSVLEQLVSSK